MIPVEREVKIVLETERDYERLCRSLPGFMEEVTQRNTYWDLPDSTLTRAGILLRLRLEKRQAWLTVKRDLRKHPDGFFEAPEDEEEVDRSQAELVLSGTHPLDSLDCAPLDRLRSEVGSLAELRPWGSLENRRRRYQLREGLVAEVDSSAFGQEHVDYEVEVESSDPAAAREVIVSYLDAEGLSYRTQTRTKSERLRAYLDQPS